MTTFEITSYPDLRNSFSIESLFPYLTNNLRRKLKKYDTVEKLLDAIYENQTTLSENEEIIVVDEMFRIDKNMINYHLGLLKNPKLDYFLKDLNNKNTLKNNEIISQQLLDLKETTKDVFLLELFEEINDLNFDNICFDFISAQLVNYFHAENKSFINAKKIKIFDFSKGINNVLENDPDLFLPLSTNIKKNHDSSFLEFIKNISDFGITSYIHATTFNNETLSFIKKIDSKFVFKVRRAIN